MTLLLLSLSSRAFADDPAQLRLEDSNGAIVIGADPTNPDCVISIPEETDGCTLKVPSGPRLCAGLVGVAIKGRSYVYDWSRCNPLGLPSSLLCASHQRPSLCSCAGTPPAAGKEDSVPRTDDGSALGRILPAHPAHVTLATSNTPGTPIASNASGPSSPPVASTTPSSVSAACCKIQHCLL